MQNIILTMYHIQIVYDWKAKTEVFVKIHKWYKMIG